MSTEMEGAHHALSDAVKKIDLQESNPVAQLDQDITYINPDSFAKKKHRVINDDEPLIDTTAAIPLRSKKTERAQKRLQKKQAKVAQRPIATQLLDLPPELLHDILVHLRPSDVFRFSAVSRSAHTLVTKNASSLARGIVRRRYWVLSRCFFLPVAFDAVDPAGQAALLHERRQDMLTSPKRQYEHIRAVDPRRICTCATCVLAWNQLCAILDLAHWQRTLDAREPLPVVPRGSQPAWNRALLDAHAAVVERAMAEPLTLARILEAHLATTVGTIMRTVRKRYTVHPLRLYYLTPADAHIDTDEFLERHGPHNHEFPYRRDQYHYLDAYAPSRHWSKEKGTWIYYARNQHPTDLQLVMRWYPPASAGADRDDAKPEPPSHSWSSSWAREEFAKFLAARESKP